MENKRAPTGGFKRGLSARGVKSGLKADLTQSTSEHKVSAPRFLSGYFELNFNLQQPRCLRTSLNHPQQLTAPFITPPSKL